MNTQDKLQELSKEQLITIINWTRNDLHNAGTNRGLNSYVRGWCRMLLEAIDYQVDKAFNKLVKEEE
jgi:hypothetical protein